MNLNTVMLGSEDAKALSAFYTKVLGKPKFEDESNGFVGWEAGSSWLVIGPHSEVKGVNEMPGRIMLNFETEDVKAEFARIKGLGVKVKQEPYSPGGGPKMLMATFEDVDGNYFQLASPMPEDMQM